MSRLFTDKFFPKDFSEFIGNIEIVEKARKWASLWENGKTQKPLFFHGATGTGKTCLVHLLSKQFDWHLFEMNASDFRSKDIVERLAAAASQSSSFSGKPRLVLLDEVDGLQSADRGGAGAMAKILKESRNPVILTANDIYAKQTLAPLRTGAELLQFKKINYLSINKRLREICEQEKIIFDADALKELSKNCAGDFRSALLDLQTLSFGEGITMDSIEILGKRLRQENIFKVIESIFKAKTVSEARDARFKSEISNDLLLRWIEENIPRFFLEKDDMASAFNMLSKADIFEGRIWNRQHYGFKRYSSELMTSGVALSKTKDYHGWIQYQFPGLLRKLSSNKATRNLKKELGSKIGKKIHSSSRGFIANDLAFFHSIFASNPIAYAAEFSFDEKEIAFLLKTKPTTKKVQKILEAAQELRQKEMALKRRPLQALEEKDLQKIVSEGPLEKDEIPKPDEKQAKLF